MNEFGLPSDLIGQQRGKWSTPFLGRLFDPEILKQEYEQQKHLFGNYNRTQLHFQ